MSERNHPPLKTGDIPLELHEEILVRLPANDLLNFKCVSKDWLRLISSPQFIHKHLHRSKVCCNVTRYLIPLSSEFIFYNYNASGDNIGMKIPYPAGFSRGSTIILGSCDGLICLLDKCGRRRRFVTFNPSTGKSDIRIVDDLDLDWSDFSWFGRHPSTGEYVLVIGTLLWSPTLVKFEVYKFCCKLKSVQSCSIQRELAGFGVIGTLLHGSLHWTATELDSESIQCKVLAYDFEKNEILEIAGPGESYFILGVVDGCLSAILDAGQMSELWIMKEYGVEQSWTKFGNTEGYRYSLSDKEAALLKDQRIDSEAILYTDSLVSPALIWGNSSCLSHEEEY